MPLISNALTTLDTLKQNLGIDTLDTSQDAYLERKINSLSEFIERELDRKLGKTDYDENYVGNGRQYLILNQWPILTIDEILVNITLLDPTEYIAEQKDKDNGMIFKPTGWTWQGYFTGYVGEPTAPIRSINVKYTAGYVLPKDATEENPRTLPYDLEDLLLQMISEDYNKKGSEGLKRFSISDIEWEWSQELKQSYIMVLNRYKRYIV